MKIFTFSLASFMNSEFKGSLPALPLTISFFCLEFEFTTFSKVKIKSSDEKSYNLKKKDQISYKKYMTWYLRIKCEASKSE